MDGSIRPFLLGVGDTMRAVLSVPPGPRRQAELIPGLDALTGPTSVTLSVTLGVGPPG
ncbi:MAG: hypothetical protein R2715_13420 [Ilumatobacteraceae bacterium]